METLKALHFKFASSFSIQAFSEPAESFSRSQAKPVPATVGSRWGTPWTGNVIEKGQTFNTREKRKKFIVRGRIHPLSIAYPESGQGAGTLARMARLPPPWLPPPAPLGVPQGIPRSVERRSLSSRFRVILRIFWGPSVAFLGRHPGRIWTRCLGNLCWLP